jgi:hypothetical protein
MATRSREAVSMSRTVAVGVMVSLSQNILACWQALS